MGLILFLFAVFFLVIFCLIEAIAALRAERQAQQDAAPKESLRRKRLGDGLAPWLGLALITRTIRAVENLVLTSGVGTPVGVLTFVGLLLALTATVSLLLDFPPNVAAAAILACLALPLGVLVMARRRRMARLVSQLPDALGMLVRSLRAGHPVPTGIKLIADEMPEPIGGEFRLIHQSMAYGLNLRQALEKMSARLVRPEIHYMVAAIRIHSATGGNLADVLASLATVIKQREILRLKVSALSAQSRMSGNILSIVPFAIVFLMVLINPDYYAEVYSHPQLAYVMGGAAAVTFVGILAIRRIVNFRV
ncbi:MAG TPA: type II secretion system F family protein [Magnetospirillum sp.]|jgi:tight adherence protein B|nr:type II secretion system F family protein [Magnetospirillum sp.]